MRPTEGQRKIVKVQKKKTTKQHVIDMRMEERQKEIERQKDRER